MKAADLFDKLEALNWIGTPDTMRAEGVIALLIGALHIRFLRKEKLKKQQPMPALGEQNVQVV